VTQVAEIVAAIPPSVTIISFSSATCHRNLHAATGLPFNWHTVCPALANLDYSPQRTRRTQRNEMAVRTYDKKSRVLTRTPCLLAPLGISVFSSASSASSAVS
jgi:hypothetical protein